MLAFAIIVVVLGLGVLATWNIMPDLDLEPKQSRPEPIQVSTHQPKEEHCLLCNAPLRRAVSTDEVVFEVERRIGDDTLAINQLLRQPASEDVRRLYVA